MNRRAFLPILVATFASLVLGGCNLSKSKPAAESAVQQFHADLDRGDFAAIYAAAHPEFKKVTTEKDFSELLSAVHRKLGLVKSTNEVGWNVNTFNMQTNVTLNYETKFAEGDARESFTYRVAGEKVALLRYNIESRALITK